MFLNFRRQPRRVALEVKLWHDVHCWDCLLGNHFYRSRWRRGDCPLALQALSASVLLELGVLNLCLVKSLMIILFA